MTRGHAALAAIVPLLLAACTPKAPPPPPAPLPQSARLVEVDEQWRRLMGEDWERAEWAASALAELRPEVEARIPELIGAVGRSEGALLNPRLSLLASIGPGSAFEAQALEALAAEVDGPREVSFPFLCDLLRRFKAAARPVAPKLVAHLAAQPPAPNGGGLGAYHDLQHATLALSEICVAPEDAAYLIELSRHESLRVRVLALGAMTQPGCIDRLCEALDGDDPYEQSAARAALADLREHPDRVLPALGRYLTRVESDYEREVTARVMTGFGAAAVPVMAAIASDASQPEGARTWCISAWRRPVELGRRELPPEARAFLEASAKSEDALIADAARRTLARLEAE